MKKWFVNYKITFYGANGNLTEASGFTRVQSPDKYAARQKVIKAYINISVKVVDGPSSKILKVTITNIKEADNGR